MYVGVKTVVFVLSVLYLCFYWWLQQDARYWEGLVERDNDIRKDLGLAAPSIDELQLLLDAPEPVHKPWSADDISLLLNRSKQERTELDEIKQYHKARLVGHVVFMLHA